MESSVIVHMIVQSSVIEHMIVQSNVTVESSDSAL